MFTLIKYPDYTYATSNSLKNTGVKMIYNSLKVDELEFNKISFYDYSYTNKGLFGISGDVYNNGDVPVIYKVIINYYDKNYKLITTNSNIQKIEGDSNKSYEYLSNINEIDGKYSIEDICYYDFIVETNPSVVDVSNMLSESMLSENGFYKSYDYVIDDYDVNIRVNEDNTFDITEKIIAYFNEPQEIFKKVITGIDNQSNNTKIKISNVEVNRPYKIIKNGMEYEINIEPESGNFNGKQEYIISYTYDIGKDKMKGYDEFYYNIINSEWDTAISNIKFEIVMPKNFNSNNLQISTDDFNFEYDKYVNYNLDGNKITGNYNGILDKYESLTVRLELPEGYFLIKDNLFRQFDFNYNYLLFLIPITFLLISIWLVHKYGGNEKIIESEEYYPPDNLNSMEMGFLYKGFLNVIDLESMIIYFVSKGYIKLKLVPLGKKFVSRFSIVKIRDYDGNNKDEKIFFDALFKKKENNSKQFLRDDLSDETYISDLYYSFSNTKITLQSMFNNDKSKEKIFDINISSKKSLIFIMIIVTLILITVPLFMHCEGIVELFEILVIPLACYKFAYELTISNSILNIRANGIKSAFKLAIKPLTLILVFIFIFIIWYSCVLPILENNIFNLIFYIIGFISIIGMTVCTKYLNKRTEYGNLIFSKIESFRNFLINVQEKQLEVIMKDNPNYFYDMLPYTYVLDITDVWFDKFKNISVKEQSWYQSTEQYDFSKFKKLYEFTKREIESVIEKR